MTGHETWIDRQIREATERGDFDNLPGAGKPIEGLGDRRDDDWWAKSLIERERLPMPLPPSLALRKEVEGIRVTLAKQRSEAEARRVAEDLNERVLSDRRRISDGPAIFVRTVDVGAALRDWHEDRAAWQERRRREVDALRQTRAAEQANRPARRWRLLPWR